MRNFTRTMLTSCHMEVRNFDPNVAVSNASVTLSTGGGNRKQYFFQFQQPGYANFDTWVTADDAYDAKCKGWDAWMQDQRKVKAFAVDQERAELAECYALGLRRYVYGE